MSRMAHKIFKWNAGCMIWQFVVAHLPMPAKQYNNIIVQRDWEFEKRVVVARKRGNSIMDHKSTKSKICIKFIAVGIAPYKCYKLLPEGELSFAEDDSWVERNEPTEWAFTSLFGL